tara:strand:- start:918 stop:1118 length:201 start_codon:yes stop_codon:yes gene_type:complete
MKALVHSNEITKSELWLQQAPSFNFEFDEDQLLELAIKKGFVIQIDAPGEPKYIINDSYSDSDTYN